MMTELEEELLNKCHYFKEECDKLKSENSELRERLAVYWGPVEAAKNFVSEYPGTAMASYEIESFEPVYDWLQRISSANEVKP